MKKIIVLALCLVMLLGVAALTSACTPKTETYELALITDIGTINDKSFNQGAWEGLEKYAQEFDKTYKYYQPLEKTTDAYVSTIELAITGGAKVIVTPGFLFEPAIYAVQDLYPEITFILLDGIPNNGDYSNFVSKVSDNTYSIFYAEEQAGFLAGYAAVKDGYTKLGFMGGMAVPAVVRYGYGFVQGANYAATEMSLADGAIDMNYFYKGDFNASPEAQAKAASWYTGGTEIIFGCGGAVGNSVMTAAEAATKKVIGVDVDQSAESVTVVTSSMKMLGNSVYDALTAYYANTFPGGESVVLDAADDAVGLPNNFTKFTTFNKAAYDVIFAKLVANEITISKDVVTGTTTAITIEEINTAATKVDVTFEATPEA